MDIQTHLENDIAEIIFSGTIDAEYKINDKIKNIANNKYDGDLKQALNEIIKNIDYGILSDALIDAINDSIKRME